MNIEKNYQNHLKENIFSDNKLIRDKQQKILNKLISKKFDKKNNESLKNISFSDLIIFDYNFNHSNFEPSITKNNKNYEITIVNGVCKNYLDDNLEIRNLLETDSNKLLEQFEQNHDDIIIDLNKIFLNSGFFIDIKKNAEINIKITYKTEKNQTIFQNNLFNFHENCKVKLQDEFNFSDNTINNINHNICLFNGAQIDYNIFQNFSYSNKLYLTSNTLCEESSNFNQNTYNFANGVVRNFHSAKLNGEFSNASLKGCFFLKDENICTNKTYIVHNAENCVSNQTYKGILNNYSKANYFSNTIVSKSAQKTEGYQLSKGILLTDKCSFFSKPELRIFADDVKCSHGSTIGPVDENALYYLRSRGINKNQAMKMIISSFIAEDLKNLDNYISDKISDYMSEYLKSLE